MSETYTPDNLPSGGFPLVTGAATILIGEVLTRGAVLGKVTASGKYIVCDIAAIDGSEAPLLVLAEDVDATAADAEAVAYMTGEFNEDQISLGGATVADDVRDALRALSIFLQTPSN